MTDYLSLDDVLEIAEAVVGDTVQVRDSGLLASAVTMPQMSVYGQDAYPDMADKSAILLYSIVRNHCLIDGNKRLAWACARIFLLLNDLDLAYTTDEAESLVLSAATGSLDPRALAADLRYHLN